MSSEAGSTSASTAGSFVYVNGDRLFLMEDYRLPLYQYFPEGTKLFDPTHVPPREVPLSTSADENGVTLPKLLPNAQYHAFFKDPRTGSLYATATKYVCLYVSHLPFDTTPEMLGRYFETFDMVKEADVFPGQATSCNGRGWVILQDTSKLLIIPRVLQFYGKHFIYTELSDREPAREKLYQMISESMLPPPPPPPPPPPHNPNVPAPRSSIIMERRIPPAALTPIGGGLDYEGPALPAPRSQQRLQASNGSSMAAVLAPAVPLASSPAGTPAPAAALQSSAVIKGKHTATFVTYITEKDADDAVREDFFWPSSVLSEELHACADSRGSAVVVFLLSAPPTVFGYARVLPNWVQGRREAKACSIEWVQHHCCIPEAATRSLDGLSLFKQRDGTRLRPEAGADLRDFIDSYLGRAECSVPLSHSGPSIPLPRGRGGVVRSDRNSARPPPPPLPPPPIGRGRGSAGVYLTTPPVPASDSGLAIPIPASRRNQLNNGSSMNGATSPPGKTGSGNSRGESPPSLSIKLPAPASARVSTVPVTGSAPSSNGQDMGGSSNGNSSTNDMTSSPTVPPAPRSKKSGVR